MDNGELIMKNVSDESILHSPLSIIHFYLKPAVFIVCLIPFGQLAYRAYADDLGVNPIDTITRFTGSWALIFLLACLAVTPLRRITGWNELIKFRRMLGLFAFSYALSHFATYLVLDHFFNWPAIGKDILKRPYVTAGFTALLILLPLALTSTAAMIRRLGKRWLLLHRLVYLAAIARMMCWRSTFSKVSINDESSTVSSARSIESSICTIGPLANTTARSMTFCNSRMFPGQAYLVRLSIDFCDTPRISLPRFLPNRLRKKFTKSGMSSRRSRSGGTSSGNTFRR